MGTNLFKDFYSEFICLALDLEYTSKMFIRKFKHKLISHLQDRLNSGVKLSTFILALAKCCLSIYKQMQATDTIRKRTKLLQSTSTPALIYLNIKTDQVSVSNSCTNTSFSRLSSSVMRTLLPITQHSEKVEER